MRRSATKGSVTSSGKQSGTSSGKQNRTSSGKQNGTSSGKQNGTTSSTASEPAKLELDSVDVVHLTTVLEDCVDQFVVLGRIMPASYDAHPGAENMVADEIRELLQQQKQIENKYEQVIERKQQAVGVATQPGKQTEMDKEFKTTVNDLRHSTTVLARGLKQSPVSASTLEKVQSDRGFTEIVLYGTLVELAQSATFHTLTEAVNNEKGKKAALQEMILKEEEGRRRVKALQKQLVDVRREKEVELQHRNEMIAHLKDQLQEMKAKTSMEGKYIKKVAEVSVAQAQKKCGLTEKEMRDDIKEMKTKIDEETRVNAEVESYLLSHTQRLQKQVEHWMEKYDKDVEQKQKELDILKASKAKDLERLQYLTKLYSDYEQVVVEDRIEKEKARRKAELETEQLKCAVKVQAWWRGMMVRKCLGSFSKKKGKKGKKGKGKKK